MLYRVKKTLRCWRERQANRKMLASLDERLLSDIGLDRFSALEEASKPFWRA